MNRSALRLILSALILCCAATAWFFYPAAVVSLSGDDIPHEWRMSLVGKSHEDVVRLLGAPTEDLAAKDMQTWVRNEWWGKYVLQVGFEHCCTQDSLSGGASITGIVDVGFGRSKRFVVHSDWKPDVQ